MAKPLELFLCDAEGLLPRLRAAMAATPVPHWDEALRVLHTFKGNAATLGQPALSRYAHTLESILSRFKAGAWCWNLASAQALAQALEALGSALVLIHAGDEPDLGTAVKVMALALKGAQVSASLPAVSPQSTVVVPEPATQEPASHYVLLVKVGGEEFSLPALCVEEVIHQPEILPVVGTLLTAFEDSASPRHARLVRFNGCLMPLLSLDALLPDNAPRLSRPCRASLPWVVILRPRGAPEHRDMSLCLPVDEVLEVCHAESSGPRTRILTSEHIREAAEKIAS